MKTSTRFTGAVIGVALTGGLMLGPPGAVASEPTANRAEVPATAPAAPAVPVVQHRNADKNQDRKRACYLDDGRPCHVTKKAGKRHKRMFMRHKNKRLKHWKWKRTWKHPKKVRRMFTRKLRRHSRYYKGMRPARIFRHFKRSTNCYIEHPWTSAVNCKNGVNTKHEDFKIPTELKILGACAGGRAIVAFIPAVGWGGFGAGTLECFFSGYLGYKWGAGRSAGPQPIPVT